MTEFEVVKQGQYLALPAQTVDQVDFGAALNNAVQSAMDRMGRAAQATSEERVRWVEEGRLREAERARERAEQRAATTTTPLTVDGLLTKMDWSREYAEHLVQPYCECGNDMDGWSYCQHAKDLGLAP